MRLELQKEDLHELRPSQSPAQSASCTRSKLPHARVKHPSLEVRGFDLPSLKPER